MRSVLGLDIRPSTLKGAGRGLYTLWERKSGDLIVDYLGETIDKKELDRRYLSANFLAVYALVVTADCFIDSACWRSIGAYANGSCKGSKPNARFKLSQGTRTARIVAAKFIPANSEIIVSLTR